MGRNKKAEYLKAKNVTFKLYGWEVEIIRNIIKTMHKSHASVYRDFKDYTVTKRLILSSREQFIQNSINVCYKNNK